MNTTFGYSGGVTSDRTVGATEVRDDWQLWTAAGLQNTTGSIDNAGLTGAELNRTIALIDELYDDFEHVSETYLLTTLAVLGIVLNTVAMAATCRERHMRRMSRAMHGVFFAAENLFLAGFVPETSSLVDRPGPNTWFLAGYVGFLQLRAHERRLHRNKEHDLEVPLCSVEIASQWRSQRVGLGGSNPPPPLKNIKKIRR